MAYIDGFVAAVPNAKKDDYLVFAERAWPVFQTLGALAAWECWGDEIPEGEMTSFAMAVKAKDDETVVFSWTAWPDKETREAGWERMMSDPEISAAMGEMPMDGKRMIYGGFSPIMVQGKMPEFK